MTPIADRPKDWFDGLKHGTEENHRFEVGKEQVEKAVARIIENGLRDGNVVDISKPLRELLSPCVFVWNTALGSYEWRRAESVNLQAAPLVFGEDLED